MIKILYSIGSILMISAFFLFAVCGLRILQNTAKVNGNMSGNNYDSGFSIRDQFKMVSTAAQSGTENVSPLVEKAMEFALYLNPPKPPENVITNQPAAVLQPVYRPSTSIRFRLLSISYYLSSPEKSWALISEPGRGEHWVKKGERIANFVVDSIEKGAIVYKDGSSLQKMYVSVPEPAQLAQVISHDKISIVNPQNDLENEMQETPVSSPDPDQIFGPG